MFGMTESEQTKSILSSFYDLHLNGLINLLMHK